MSIIGAEDEDFENDLHDASSDDQWECFSTIEKLKERPTHLLVFLQHVILQFDPAPLLCYLHADLFKTLSAKEAKKHFVEFCNTFLDKGATEPAPISSLMRLQRRYALEVQALQGEEVAKQLEDFRQKRMMGMTPNEAELMDVEHHYPTDRVPMEMKEKSVAENLLDKMSETQPTIVSDEEKCQSIFSAVAFYMKHLGVKTRAVDSKKSRGGFFRRQLVKNKKEESSKAKPRGVFPGIPSWIAGSTEVKPKSEAEADKEKANVDRKGPAPGRSSLSEPAASSVPRKSAGSAAPASLPVLEVGEGSASTVGAPTSPEAAHPDGLPTNRLEPPSVSDGGDVSPVGLGAGLTIGEPVFPSSTPTEENLERDRRKTSRKVTRSESARVDRHSSRRHGSSRAKQSRSRSDVDLQPPAPTSTPAPFHPQLLHPFEGPVLDPEGPSHSPTSPSPQLEEMEPRFLEFEQDPPNWRDLACPEALTSLSKKERKRQEVINDNFYENLKKLRLEDNFIVKSISTTLLSRFGGTEGEWFQKLTSRFCSHQSWALDQIKNRQKREPRFNSFILEAESKPQCRRLQLKDIIPIEMQRLTKYPLLLENIAKNTEDLVEKDRIQQSAECCRKILNHVNEEVKVMENLLTLKEYQRKLDTSGLKPSNDLYTEYKNIDLTQKKMLYEGPVTWKVTKEKAIEVQCVLLGDLLVLLQKQDDKMVLKCQSKSTIAVQEGKQMLSPIIKLDSVFLREVATDRKAFYVIFTWDSGAQIYELVAQSVGERKIPTENGGILKGNIDRDKDSLTDDKSSELRHRLIDFLSDKGFDLIGHSNSHQETVANIALDEVMSLKRLLVGSISLSDDSQLDEENGEDQSESTSQEVDPSAWTEEEPTAFRGGEKETDHSGDKDVEAKQEEERSISAPLVLSQEKLEKVYRKLQSLQEQVKRLQLLSEAFLETPQTLMQRLRRPLKEQCSRALTDDGRRGVCV
ncbi:hypothetical protein fugu_010307 [Takifugu bimaculatus]|uniref:DH domain-containing protein n=1 Tax=Takifugu bimaculatus TaxID=433685 RepID=A0A4Z2CFA9_9TELE|nr:hypothetical protein fugu_010307 [Takifugu bimaculatus]